jgi:hypothetical protein
MRERKERRQRGKGGEGGVGEREDSTGRERERGGNKGVSVWSRWQKAEESDTLDEVTIGDDRTLLLPATNRDGIEGIDSLRRRNATATSASGKEARVVASGGVVEPSDLVADHSVRGRSGRRTDDCGRRKVRMADIVVKGEESERRRSFGLFRGRPRAESLTLLRRVMEPSAISRIRERVDLAAT